MNIRVLKKNNFLDYHKCDKISYRNGKVILETKKEVFTYNLKDVEDITVLE